MRTLYSIALQDSSLAYTGTAYGYSILLKLKRVHQIKYDQSIFDQSPPTNSLGELLGSRFVSLLSHRGVVILAGCH